MKFLRFIIFENGKTIDLGPLPPKIKKIEFLIKDVKDFENLNYNNIGKNKNDHTSS